ncbi:hypothetical protein AX14_011510 [Amanita brunnescens Koide BX004]|nr:hypothetical protein AX14_011510 [Amanita brunnescens Koide BX004]
MNADEGEGNNKEPMQEDGIEMISDDLAHHIPCKQSRSPSTVAMDGTLTQNPDPSSMWQAK